MVDFLMLNKIVTMKTFRKSFVFVIKILLNIYKNKVSKVSKQINDKPFVVDSFDAKQYENEKKVVWII